MKRIELLAALIAASGIAAVSNANAALPDDAVAYEAAVAKGSIMSLQEFISTYADSPYAIEALGQMIDLAANGAGETGGKAGGAGETGGKAGGAGETGGKAGGAGETGGKAGYGG